MPGHSRSPTQARRPALVLLAIGACALGIALVLQLALGKHDVSPTARGSAGIADIRPVPQRQAAIDDLHRTVSRYTTDCVAQLPAPTFEFPASADAIGVVRCRPSGTGATVLRALRFADDRGTSAEFADYSHFLPRARGPCDAGAGSTTWQDRRALHHGGMICGFDGGTAYIAWSDATTHTIFVVEGTSESDLKTWWSKAIRPLPGRPTVAEKQLYAAIARRVDTKRCYRDDTGGSPFSAASIICSPARLANGKPVDASYLFFESFPTRNDLTRYLDAVVAVHAPTASNDPTRTCGQVATELEPWSDTRQTEGTRFCWSDNGDESLGWTIEEKHVYGELRRDDGHMQRTYDAWRSVSGGD